MKKRILSFMLLLTILSTVLSQFTAPVFAATYTGSCGKEATWHLDTETGVLTISGTGNMDYYTGIDSWAPWYAHRQYIKTVQVKEGITTIGGNSFLDCVNLKTVSLPNTLQIMHEGAFLNCTGLTSIEIPNSVTMITDGVFMNCSNLASIRIPDSVSYLGLSVFKNCTGLKEVVVGNGLRDLGEYTFQNCTSLTSITIPDYLQAVTGSLFAGCSSLTQFCVSKNHSLYQCDEFGALLYKNGTEFVAFPPGRGGSYQIPESVTTIRGGAFNTCTKLTNVTIPKSVTCIQGDAFSGCTGLQSIVIPSSVIRLGSAVFENCTALKEITLPGEIYTIETRTFMGCTELKTVTIESNQPTIYWGAFMDCPKLTDIYFLGKAPVLEDSEFPEGVTLHYLEGMEGWTSPSWNGYSTEASVFFDINSEDYYYQPVCWAVEKNITNGTGKGLFSPEKDCTRGQIVTFLWRAAGSPEPMGSENPFSDVSSDAYYYKAVLWAVEKGITTGTGNGKFSPDKTCTRGQVATFLWRAENKPEPESKENPFLDLEPSEYYYDAVLWAVEQGITNGTGKGNFSPERTCTRGQIATFLYRTYF